jgi:hypothetical protein
LASEVDICNLALGFLGDTASVSSINPPEGSAQAQHCARFYPIARNMLLETAAWNFATKRAILAEVTNTWEMWQYAYAMPSGVLTVISVLPLEATDDYSAAVSRFPDNRHQIPMNAVYMPQPYAIEVNSSSQQVILTNQANAVLRYTFLATDSSRFSSLFVVALSWLLASMLAGPLIKGDAGAAEAKRCLQMFQEFEAKAGASDANQSEGTPQQATPWITNR